MFDAKKLGEAASKCRFKLYPAYKDSGVASRGKIPVPSCFASGANLFCFQRWVQELPRAFSAVVA